MGSNGTGWWDAGGWLVRIGWTAGGVGVAADGGVPGRPLDGRPNTPPSPASHPPWQCTACEWHPSWSANALALHGGWQRVKGVRTDGRLTAGGADPLRSPRTAPRVQAIVNRAFAGTASV